MTDRTITLRSELVEQLESLAEQQKRTVDDMVSELLSRYAPTGGSSWALRLAEHMEAADIAWLDDPDASVNSRAHYQRYLREKWFRTQDDDYNG